MNASSAPRRPARRAGACMACAGAGNIPGARQADAEEDAMSVMRFDPFGDPFRQMDRLSSQLLSGAR
ncbi:hypothetical protein, partial [Quadrisphaera sp. DSM 44207]|uniref:hypothetical protein n=1 Tax=Quadrisphaera sp. DSM 44207 TaxID=1881057 RepID=UPI001C40B9C0